MSFTRRRFVKASLGATAALMTGCAGDDTDGGAGGGGGGGPDAGTDAGTDLASADVTLDSAIDAVADAAADVISPVVCDDPFDGGQLLSSLLFLDEPSAGFHQRGGAGHDGRLSTDLREIEPGVLVTPTENFYIRTMWPDQITTAPDDWTIRIDGLVSSAVTVGMNDLTPLVRPMGNHVLECSGNTYHGAFGLLSAGDWQGVPIGEVLAMADAMPSATGVLITGLDERRTRREAPAGCSPSSSSSGRARSWRRTSTASSSRPTTASRCAYTCPTGTAARTSSGSTASASSTTASLRPPR